MLPATPTGVPEGKGSYATAIHRSYEI